MWLLLLALPLQGYAAATMLHCGPNHHRMMTAAWAEPAATRDHAVTAPHHHAMGMADGHHEAASAEGSPDAPPLPHLDKLMKFKCQACPVCCLGAAMPTDNRPYPGPCLRLHGCLPVPLDFADQALFR